ncbi:hypothetical protein AGMMS49942_28610 [Spirochaetia bacterium]|nr:hypothetical protein AGMMS49942_28610 [Spirochaetia bacterium]
MTKKNLQLLLPHPGNEYIEFKEAKSAYSFEKLWNIPCLIFFINIQDKLLSNLRIYFYKMSMKLIPIF